MVPTTQARTVGWAVDQVSYHLDCLSSVSGSRSPCGMYFLQRSQEREARQGSKTKRDTWIGAISSGCNWTKSTHFKPPPSQGTNLFYSQENFLGISYNNSGASGGRQLSHLLSVGLDQVISSLSNSKSLVIKSGYLQRLSTIITIKIIL